MSTEPIQFSIIIPTYNRAQQLTACLSALERQTYNNRRFEVIVVNDGGDSLEAVIADYNECFAIQLINQQNTGPAQARNKGAIAAKGKVLVFIDDDCCPATDWLDQLDRVCSSYPNVLIGGRTLNSLSNNPYSTASQLIVELAYRYHNPSPEQSQFFASNNMAFPRQAFLSLGGFHPNFRASEDREICDRWLRHGHSMYYADTVQISHAHALSFQSFWQQHVSYGRGAFLYHTIRAMRGAAPFRPDFSFYGQLLIYPFQRLPIHHALTVVWLMILSQLASTVGYIREQRQQSQCLNQLKPELNPLYD